MVPHLPAAILVLMDRPHPEKQRALAVAAATAENMNVVALCFRWEDCVALVLSEYIVAVVSACDPGVKALRALEDAGARLVVARVDHRVRRDVTTLAIRMYQREMDTHEISLILQMPKPDVAAILDRAGIRRRK